MPRLIQSTGSLPSQQAKNECFCGVSGHGLHRLLQTVALSSRSRAFSAHETKVSHVEATGS
ncbi:protein of unknown function [Azospirillum baldaniorum]|uniref:Uncharacterized protein n=1 Tax=Azospirillum baldaniorum TaxID=1064539 RepID=A0A9P1JQ07_9PROT|nr:protein of unknown function [Azospirillum baldaniorum]